MQAREGGAPPTAPRGAARPFRKAKEKIRRLCANAILKANPTTQGG